jgi:catechol 2,3-dioxygenase-like lactoylglutathione lyase family enzyme
VPWASLLASRAVPGGIHHSVVVVRDLEASLRFYRDGLGLDLLQDRQVEGDWPDLFGAPSRRVRAVFLGDAQVPDDHAGVLELNVFDGDVPAGPPAAPPRTGFFLLLLFVDVKATLSRLAALGLGGPPRRVSQSIPRGPIPLATVRDPDGCLSCSPPVRSPALCNELTAWRQARHRGCHPSPHGTNNGRSAPVQSHCWRGIWPCRIRDLGSFWN